MVSIIIPVYNTEQYIQDCLTSIIAQDYTDWECILVDDGSTDNSGEICDEFASQDSRFRVVHKINAGVSDARNSGMESALGEWVCFIDSDDWIGEKHLQNLVNAISDEIDYVISGNEMILDGKLCRHIHPSEYKVFPLNAAGSEPMADLLEQHLPYGPTNKLFRKSIIQRQNIKFPTNTSYGEDLLFNFSYFQYVRNIATVPISDYYYRQIGSSLSHKTRPDRFNNDYYQWCVRRDFLVCHDMWTDRIKLYMYKELWGVVYDGLFECSVKCTYGYVKRILSIPEIDKLSIYKNDFICSYWIKWAILHRTTYVFWLIRQRNKLLLF